MPEFLYGRWPVLEALRANRRKFEQLLLLETFFRLCTKIISDFRSRTGLS